MNSLFLQDSNNWQSPIFFSFSPPMSCYYCGFNYLPRNLG